MKKKKEKSRLSSSLGTFCEEEEDGAGEASLRHIPARSDPFAALTASSRCGT